MTSKENKQYSEITETTYTVFVCLYRERAWERLRDRDRQRYRASWGYHFMREEPEVIKLNSFLEKMTINLNNQESSINWPAHIINKWYLHVK